MASTHSSEVRMPDVRLSTHSANVGGFTGVVSLYLMAYETVFIVPSETLKS